MWAFLTTVTTLTAKAVSFSAAMQTSQQKPKPSVPLRRAFMEHIPIEIIEKKIYLIRNQRVMLSVDLAELYGVETRALNQAVKRNIERFPEDFMFILTENEANSLVSQNVIPHKKYLGGHLPYAFTEQGIAMLSSVLKSGRAVKVNIEIMRTFVKIRKIIFQHKDLADKLARLEIRTDKHDKDIKAIIDAIRQLMSSPEKPARKIGF